MLAKFTTRPLAILTSGRNVLVISISPHRFTSAVRLNILIGAQSIGSMYPIPALFTSPHSPPAQEEILNDCIKSRRVIRRAVFFLLLLITIIVGWLNGPDLRPIISQYHTRVGFWKGLITMLNNPRCQGAVTYNVTPKRADPITLFFRNVLGKWKLT